MNRKITINAFLAAAVAVSLCVNAVLFFQLNNLPEKIAETERELIALEEQRQQILSEQAPMLRTLGIKMIQAPDGSIVSSMLEQWNAVAPIFTRTAEEYQEAVNAKNRSARA